MDRIIQSPGKYIQGADVINRLGEYLKPLAERWLVVGDKFVLGFAQTTIAKSFKDAGIGAEIAPFGGECSQNEINRLRRIAENAQCCAVLGIGGGKTLGVSILYGCSCCSCPNHCLNRRTLQRPFCYLH